MSMAVSKRLFDEPTGGFFSKRRLFDDCRGHLIVAAYIELPYILVKMRSLATPSILLSIFAAAKASDNSDANPFAVYEANCPKWDATMESPPADYPTYRQVPPGMTIPAAWQASYPGSGADMTVALIIGLTGLGFEYISDLERLSHVNDPGDRTVSVKTHYPRFLSFPPPDDFQPHEYLDSAVLLIRHPMNALPSYLNFEYERDNGITQHSTRASLEDWMLWRDENFEYELQAWVDHTSYWLDRYNIPGVGGDRFISVYEGVTDDVEGPAHAQALVEFLNGLDENIQPATDPDVVACIWYKFIKAGAVATHRHGQTYRPLREEHIDAMVEALLGLRARYEEREDAWEILPILDLYLDMAEDKRNEKPPADELE